MARRGQGWEAREPGLEGGPREVLGRPLGLRLQNKNLKDDILKACTTCLQSIPSSSRVPPGPCREPSVGPTSSIFTTLPPGQTRS